MRAFLQGLDTIFPFLVLVDIAFLHVWSVYVCERVVSALLTRGPLAATSLG